MSSINQTDVAEVMKLLAQREGQRIAIQARIDALSGEYHALASDDRASQSALRTKNEEIKAARKELLAMLAQGANPCPRCGDAPHGMRHPGGGKTPPSYEIGCHRCAGQFSTSFTARRGSQFEAAAAWNAGPSAWDVTSKESRKALPEWDGQPLAASGSRS